MGNALTQLMSLKDFGKLMEKSVDEYQAQFIQEHGMDEAVARKQALIFTRQKFGLDDQ